MEKLIHADMVLAERATRIYSQVCSMSPSPIRRRNPRRHPMANNQNQGSSNRGFASMDEDKQREIAAKGGRAAHESGNAHEFSSEEAREAGRKGGESVSQDRQHMADIGREGGQSRSGSQGGNQGGQQQQQRGGGNRGGQQR